MKPSSISSAAHDSDILAALKVWQFHDDFVLSEVSRRIVHRDLCASTRPGGLCRRHAIPCFTHCIALWRLRIGGAYPVINDRIDNKLYEAGGITIRFKKVSRLPGRLGPIEPGNLMRTVAKSFVCYPKE